MLQHHSSNEREMVFRDNVDAPSEGVPAIAIALAIGVFMIVIVAKAESEGGWERLAGIVFGCLVVGSLAGYGVFRLCRVNELRFDFVSGRHVRRTGFHWSITESTGSLDEIEGLVMRQEERESRSGGGTLVPIVHIVWVLHLVWRGEPPDLTLSTWGVEDDMPDHCEELARRLDTPIERKGPDLRLGCYPPE